MKRLGYLSESCLEGTTGPQIKGLSIVAPSNTGLLKRVKFCIGRFAVAIGLSERRKDGRVSARELNANCASGAEEKRVNMKDISPTGAYLLTKHQWLVGTRLLLTLQTRVRKNRDSAPQVRLQAEVVRLGTDGVGVSFVHEHVDTAQWLTLMSKATSLAPKDGAVRVFRIAKTLAFLLRFSPFAEDRILKQLREELSDERIERTLEVVLRAEELVISRRPGPKSQITPSLALRILADGSISNEEPMLQCWAGLLAATLLEGSNDEEKLSFAALLSKLEPVHVLILASAGQKALQAGLQSETTASPIVHCAIDEIKRISRSRNVAAIESTLNRLYEFGLLELTSKPFGCASLDHANLTLTKLGVAFYQACFGRQEFSEVIDSIPAEVAS